MRWAASATAVAAVALAASPVHAQGFTPMAPVNDATIALRRPAIVFALPATGVTEEQRQRLRLFVDGSDLTEFVTWHPDRLQAVSPVSLTVGDHLVELRRLTVDGDPEVVSRIAFRTIPQPRPLTADVQATDNSTIETGRGPEDALTLGPRVKATLQGTGTTTVETAWVQTVPLRGSTVLEAPDIMARHARGALTATAGLTRGETLAQARFLGMRTYRRVVEGQLDLRRAGRVSAFSTLSDRLLFATGPSMPRQWVHGLSWQPHLPTKRIELSVVGQMSRDRSPDAQDDRLDLATGERGQLVGALASIRLGRGWRVVTEVAASERDSTDRATDGTARDVAARVNVTGTVGRQTLGARLARVGSRFGNPADPGLRPDRQEAEVEISRRAEGWHYRAVAGLTTDGLDHVLTPARELRTIFGGGRRLPGAVDADVEAERSDLGGARADRQATRLRARVSHRSARAELSAVSTWSRTDDRLRDTRRDGRGLRLSVRAELPGRVTLSGGASLERTRAESDDRTRTLFLEPALAFWNERGRLAFQLSVDSRQSVFAPFDRRLAGRFSVSADMAPRLGATVALDVGWDTTSVAGRHTSSPVAAIKVLWAPEWRARR